MPHGEPLHKSNFCSFAIIAVVFQPFHVWRLVRRLRVDRVPVDQLLVE
jgi:hypothetical protein